MRYFRRRHIPDLSSDRLLHPDKICLPCRKCSCICSKVDLLRYCRWLSLPLYCRFCFRNLGIHFQDKNVLHLVYNSHCLLCMCSRGMFLHIFLENRRSFVLRRTSWGNNSRWFRLMSRFCWCEWCYIHFLLHNSWRTYCIRRCMYSIDLRPMCWWLLRMKQVFCRL